MLGVLCLGQRALLFWDTLTRWGDRKERRTRWIIGVNLALFAMTHWLLSMAGSTTSSVCVCLVAWWSPALLKVLIPVGICLYPSLQFGFGIAAPGAILRPISPQKDIFGSKVKGFGNDE
jgi:hypothetical protein